MICFQPKLFIQTQSGFVPVDVFPYPSKIVLHHAGPGHGQILTATQGLAASSLPSVPVLLQPSRQQQALRTQSPPPLPHLQQLNQNPPALFAPKPAPVVDLSRKRVMRRKSSVAKKRQKAIKLSEVCFTPGCLRAKTENFNHCVKHGGYFRCAFVDCNRKAIDQSNSQNFCEVHKKDVVMLNRKLGVLGDKNQIKTNGAKDEEGSSVGSQSGKDLSSDDVSESDPVMKHPLVLEKNTALDRLIFVAKSDKLAA